LPGAGLVVKAGEEPLWLARFLIRFDRRLQQLLAAALQHFIHANADRVEKV